MEIDKTTMNSLPPLVCGPDPIRNSLRDSLCEGHSELRSSQRESESRQVNESFFSWTRRIHNMDTSFQSKVQVLEMQTGEVFYEWAWRIHRMVIFYGEWCPFPETESSVQACINIICKQMKKLISDRLDSLRDSSRRCEASEQRSETEIPLISDHLEETGKNEVQSTAHKSCFNCGNQVDHNHDSISCHICTDCVDKIDSFFEDVWLESIVDC
jgi:hypothetical protein